MTTMKKKLDKNPVCGFVNRFILHLLSFQFHYPGESAVQLRFLRLHSITAIQSITFSCHPGHQLGGAERDVKFLTDSRTQSYLGVLKDCVVSIRPLALPNECGFGGGRGTSQSGKGKGGIFYRKEGDAELKERRIEPWFGRWIDITIFQQNSFASYPESK